MLSWQRQIGLEKKGHPFYLGRRRTQKMTAEIGICPADSLRPTDPFTSSLSFSPPPLPSCDLRSILSSLDENRIESRKMMEFRVKFITSQGWMSRQGGKLVVVTLERLTDQGQRSWEKGAFSQPRREHKML